MKRLGAALLAALLALPAARPAAAAEVSVETSTVGVYRRYKIGDTDQKHAEGWIQRIENALPVALLVILGVRGHVEVRGNSGSVSAGGGNGK